MIIIENLIYTLKEEEVPGSHRDYAFQGSKTLNVTRMSGNEKHGKNAAFG